jgi:hypothetical protein
MEGDGICLNEGTILVFAKKTEGNHKNISVSIAQWFVTFSQFLNII